MLSALMGTTFMRLLQPLDRNKLPRQVSFSLVPKTISTVFTPVLYVEPRKRQGLLVQELAKKRNCVQGFRNFGLASFLR